jgi:hypothetical protein
MADKDQKSAPRLSPFDAIRHVDEQLGEYWSARELYKILGYTEWRNFHNVVIRRALKACEENGRAVSEHFVQSYKMSQTGQGGKRRTEDVLLSRYAAYLVVMNDDPKMPIVAMGQEYFAEQTRRQELAGSQAEAAEGWLYVAIVLDLFSRLVVGWAMAAHRDAELVEQALLMALGRWHPAAGLLHHSDRGSQYTSGSYQAQLAQAGIALSMSGKGDCYDNAAMESFFSSLKGEWTDWHTYQTRKAGVPVDF